MRRGRQCRGVSIRTDMASRSTRFIQARFSGAFFIASFDSKAVRQTHAARERPLLSRSVVSAVPVAPAAWHVVAADHHPSRGDGADRDLGYYRPFLKPAGWTL